MTAHPFDIVDADSPVTPLTNASSASPDLVKKPEFNLVNAPAALTATLSAVLQAQVSRNDTLPPTPLHSMTVFHALEPPSISVADYVARVSKYVFCSEACLVAARAYVARCTERIPCLSLTSLTVHRLFITAVVLACKYHDDLSYNLTYYAKVGGLPAKELANLELHMLRALDFRLDVSVTQFTEAEQSLLEEVDALAAPDAFPMPTAPVVTLAHKARIALLDARVTFPSRSVTTVRNTCVTRRRKPVMASPVTSDGSVNTLSRNSSSSSMASEARAALATGVDERWEAADWDKSKGAGKFSYEDVLGGVGRVEGSALGWRFRPADGRNCGMLRRESHGAARVTSQHTYRRV